MPPMSDLPMRRQLKKLLQVRFGSRRLSAALPAGCHGLKVFNTMGVKVAEAGNCDNMLSLRHLAKGIYLVVAETGGAPLTAKIIMR